MNGKQAYRFFQGLVIALAFSLTAFEWKTFRSSDYLEYKLHFVDIEDEFIPITFRKKIPKPEPITPKKVDKTRLKIVKNISTPVVEPKKVPKENPIDPNLLLPVDFPPEVLPVENHPLPHAEVNPEFPGGLGEMYKFLYDSIDYAEFCREARIEGTVYAKFVVNKKGKIEDIRILRGIPGCKVLEEEVIEALKKMPDWEPGRQAGRKVSVEFMVPVKFQILD
jgi:protein TonB